MPQPTQKLRLSALIALVVGSMIGGGIFSLPRRPMGCTAVCCRCEPGFFMGQ
jgi:amino acid transporter